MCGFIAQLVEHRTGIAEVTGSNPDEALIFFRLLLSNCLNWKIYCDDRSSPSFLGIFILSQYSSHTNINACQFVSTTSSLGFRCYKMHWKCYMYLK